MLEENMMIQFLKKYIVAFISDYGDSLPEITIFETMVMVYLLGKDILENDI